MSVMAKGKRKIIVNEQNYAWYVKLDNESPFYILNIISEDKKLVLSCPLQTDLTYVISKGLVFQGKRTQGCWERYLLPFPMPKTITPQIISEIILWATQGKQAVKIAWDKLSYSY